MGHDAVRERLGHMLDAISDIERLTAGTTLAEYSKSRDNVAAVERYVERLSEASRHIPDHLKDRFPHVHWRGLADIGNVLRHAYDQVVDAEVWRAATRDLAPLRAAVEDMLPLLNEGTETR